MAERKLVFFSFTLGIIALFIFVFLLVENKWVLMLIPESVRSGEVWRFFTYSFVHEDIEHLIENCIGFALVSFIAYELGFGIKRLVVVYLISSIFAVLPVWFFLKFIAFGASAMIFALFAFESPELRSFKINLGIVYLIIAVVMFFQIKEKYSFAGHLCGFVFGLGLYCGFKIFDKRKQKILRRC